MFGNQRLPAAALAGGLAVLAALAGCASRPGDTTPGHPGHQVSAQAHGMDHDRSPAAPDAIQPGQPAATLRPDALDTPAATSVTDARRSAEIAAEMTGGGHGGHGAHASHGGGTYTHADVGRGPGAHEGPEDQAPAAGHPHHHGHEPAAPPSGHEGHSQHEPAAAVYACPMHPEVTSATPGKCPKCGMELVERRKG